MLSDLVQYFTLSKDVETCESELTYFLEMIHRNTHSLEIKNAIEKAVANPSEYLFDVFEYGINDEFYLNDIHLGDALDICFSNNIVTMLLSCLIDPTQFEVYFEDGTMEYHFDSAAIEENIEKVTLEKYNPYHLDRKINSFVNEWIIDQIKDFEDKDGYIDSYCLEYESIIFSSITFKNKSAGRKIRKAYTSNTLVRNMFHELGYYMYNGEFIMLMEYNIEGIGYNGYFEMEEVYTGIMELREHIFHDQSINEETWMFKRRMKILEKELTDYETQHIPKFFQEIINKHVCSEQEVIL